jgi:oligopeptide/dipeptide ABC transporter ATP-binding protein
MRKTRAMGELLRIEKLRKDYRISSGNPLARKRVARAVDDVSFSMAQGEALGIVGESGCGKTTLARLILRLIEPTAGEVWFEGTRITGLPDVDLRQWRRKTQIIFQDHFASFDPRLTVGSSIAFPLKVQRVAARRELGRTVVRLLERVGLDPALAKRYPHELSGGQRQRASIARAIAVGPSLIVADEPVAALDLSAQAQILNLFVTLMRELLVSFIFITHDLNVAAYLCDRIIVMYGGKVVESGDAAAVFNHPRHPYTQALISAALLGQSADTEIVLEGDPPSPAAPPLGCKFHPRCALAEGICAEIEPGMSRVGERHDVACHVVERRQAGSAVPEGVER